MKSFHEMTHQELWGEIRAMMQDEEVFQALDQASFGGRDHGLDELCCFMLNKEVFEAVTYLGNVSGTEAKKEAAQYVVRCGQEWTKKNHPAQLGLPGSDYRKENPFPGNNYFGMIWRYLK